MPAACCFSALQKNHLSGLKRKLLKVSFYNVQQLMEVRREITPTVNRNSKRSTMADAVAALAQQDAGTGGRPRVRQAADHTTVPSHHVGMQPHKDCACKPYSHKGGFVQRRQSPGVSMTWKSDCM